MGLRIVIEQGLLFDLGPRPTICLKPYQLIDHARILTRESLGCGLKVSPMRGNNNQNLDNRLDLNQSL